MSVHKIVGGLLFLLGILALQGAFAPIDGGTVDQNLLAKGSFGEDVRVLIWLEDQPTERIAREVRAVFDPRIEEINQQVISIAGQETITEAQRQKARELLAQIDAENTRMMKEITTRVRSLIAEDQENLKVLVEDLGGQVFRKLTIINALSAKVPFDKLEDIALLPKVSYIHEVELSKPKLNVSAYAIGADTWWDNVEDPGGAFDFGLVDSGIDTTHDAFSGHTFSTQPPITPQGPSGAYPSEHGTRVAGIAVSVDNTYKGIAYGADAIISAINGLQESTMFDGFDWILTESSESAEVINHSHGKDKTGSTPDYPLRAKFLDSVVDWFGIPVPQCAGNEGPNDTTLVEEGQAYNVITVGAMDDGNTVDRGNDAVWDTTSRGPTVGGRRKPDLVAPGVNIISSVPGDDWSSGSGTSYATPHIAGAVLLLKQNGPNDARRIKAVLINTADDLGPTGWDKTYGWGYVNLDSAWVHRFHSLLGVVSYTTQSRYYQGTMNPDEKARCIR